MITITSTQGEARAQRGRATHPGPQLGGQRGRGPGGSHPRVHVLSHQGWCFVADNRGLGARARSLDFGSHHWYLLGHPEIFSEPTDQPTMFNSKWKVPIPTLAVRASGRPCTPGEPRRVVVGGGRVPTILGKMRQEAGAPAVTYDLPEGSSLSSLTPRLGLPTPQSSAERATVIQTHAPFRVLFKLN